MINKNTKIYRLWEMIPGFFAWMTILFPIWGAFVFPKVVAYFVIAFLVYWLYQSFKSAILAIIGYFKIQAAKATNWQEKFQSDFKADWLKRSDVHHVIVISSYKEPNEVIEMAIGSLAAQTKINLKNIHVILGQEERAGKENNQSHH